MTTDPELVLLVHRQLTRMIAPLGAARQLSYQYRMIGGEYSEAAEVKYWKSRGGRITKTGVVFEGTPDGGPPKFKS